MKTLATALTALLTLAAGAAFGADDMKKADGMMKKENTMTVQECKDHLAMTKKDGMKKDDAAMKKDAMCADMVKQDGMKKDDAIMKKEEPMKK